jgi:hypothetical protein
VWVYTDMSECVRVWFPNGVFLEKGSNYEGNSGSFWELFGGCRSYLRLCLNSQAGSQLESDS